MPAPWHSSISGRQPLTLTVFPTKAVSSGIWSSVFTNALAEFNALSLKHKLKVTLAATTTPPDPQGTAGADVQFDATDGPQTINALGDTFTTIIVNGSPVPIQVNGSGTEGLTVTLGRGGIQKAFVLVPATPQASSRSGLVGDPVKLFIAVHELFHVVGLKNADHSPANNADVFIGPPANTPQLIADNSTPPNPDLDAVSNGLPLRQGQKRFPPLSVSAKTAGKVRDNWP